MNKTFKPTIKENQVLAGGMRLFDVDDEGQIIFPDRYRARCEQRGTPDVRVDLGELLDELLRFMRQGT